MSRRLDGRCHTSTVSTHPPRTTPFAPVLSCTWALDLDLALHSSLRRVGLDRCHRRRPRKGFTMRRKFSLAWSLVSVAVAAPASRLTTKPVRPTLPCSTVTVLKEAPPSSGVTSTGLQLGGGGMPRRALASLPALPWDEVSAGSPYLMPPGSHCRPLKNARVLPTPCRHGLNKISSSYDIAGCGSCVTS